MLFTVFRCGVDVGQGVSQMAFEDTINSDREALSETAPDTKPFRSPLKDKWLKYFDPQTFYMVFGFLLAALIAFNIISYILLFTDLKQWAQFIDPVASGKLSKGTQPGWLDYVKNGLQRLKDAPQGVSIATNAKNTFGQAFYWLSQWFWLVLTFYAASIVALYLGDAEKLRADVSEGPQKTATPFGTSSLALLTIAVGVLVSFAVFLVYEQTSLVELRGGFILSPGSYFIQTHNWADDSHHYNPIRLTYDALFFKGESSAGSITLYLFSLWVLYGLTFAGAIYVSIRYISESNNIRIVPLSAEAQKKRAEERYKKLEDLRHSRFERLKAFYIGLNEAKEKYQTQYKIFSDKKKNANTQSEDKTRLEKDVHWLDGLIGNIKGSLDKLKPSTAPLSPIALSSETLAEIAKPFEDISFDGLALAKSFRDYMAELALNAPTSGDMIARLRDLLQSANLQAENALKSKNETLEALESAIKATQQAMDEAIAEGRALLTDSLSIIPEARRLVVDIAHCESDIKSLGFYGLTFHGLRYEGPENDNKSHDSFDGFLKKFYASCKEMQGASKIANEWLPFWTDKDALPDSDDQSIAEFFNSNANVLPESQIEFTNGTYKIKERESILLLPGVYKAGDPIHNTTAFRPLAFLVTIFVIIAVGVNNFFLTPDLSPEQGTNSYLTTIFGKGPTLFWLGFAFVIPFVLLILTPWLSKSARKLLTEDNNTFLGRSGRLILSIIAGILAFGLILAIQQITHIGFRPLISQPDPADMDAALADLSCEALPPTITYDKDKKPIVIFSSNWVYAHNDLIEANVAQCRLILADKGAYFGNTLPKLQSSDVNYIVAIGVASQEGDSIEQVKLAKDRAEALASTAQKSLGKEWEGRIFILTLGQHSPYVAANVTTDKAHLFAAQRRVALLWGYSSGLSKTPPQADFDDQLKTAATAFKEVFTTASNKPASKASHSAPSKSKDATINDVLAKFFSSDQNRIGVNLEPELYGKPCELTEIGSKDKSHYTCDFTGRPNVQPPAPVPAGGAK
jgi:hypothetical protein